jgi:hypothetical protein
LSLAVGGDITNITEIDNSSFPLEMIIDYIKIYQEIEDFKYLKNLILFDDFNDEELNITNWDYYIPSLNYEEYGFDIKKEDFFYLSNSKLYMRLLMKENDKYRLFSSSVISTKNNFNFTYGIIKANISFSTSKIIESTFNIVSNISNTDEAFLTSNPNNIIFSGLKWGNDYSYCRKEKYNNISEFHEYTILFDGNSISIYIEDLDIYKIDINSKEFIYFHNPLYLQIYNSKRLIFSSDL